MSVVPIGFDDLDKIHELCNEILKCNQCKPHAIKLLKFFEYPGLYSPLKLNDAGEVIGGINKYD